MSASQVPLHPIPQEPPPAYTESTNANTSVPSSAPAPAPDWEVPDQNAPKKSRLRVGASATPARWALSDRFDRLFPPHKRYLGLSRSVFLLGAAVIFVFLLGLIIGLAVGLHKPKPKNLPLPGDVKTYNGDLTYYGPGLGACGVTSGNNDMIVSISHYTFDAESGGSDPNANPLCGQKIRAQRNKDGKLVSVDLKVVDRCTGCQPTDLDVSPGAFSKLADPDLGRVNVTWAWLPQ